MNHHPRRYSVVKKEKGIPTVFFVMSCGPCRLYGRLFRTPEARDAQVKEHPRP